MSHHTTAILCSGNNGFYNRPLLFVDMLICSRLAVLVVVVGCLIHYVNGWTVSIVPPSANPASKLNHQLLKDIRQRIGTDPSIPHEGRFRFKLPNQCLDSNGLSWIRGAPSIRVVAGEVDGLTVGDSEESIVRKLLLQWLDSQFEILDAWERFGNGLPAEEDITCLVRCRRYNDYVCSNVSTDRLSQVFNLELSRVLGWKMVRKRRQSPMLEFHVLLHGSTATLELLTLVAASSVTAVLPAPGMKRVESWALVKSVGIDAGDIVLDPMCGKGTFLVEAAAFWSQASSFVGIDLCAEQLEAAKVNMAAANVTVSLHHGDARNMAFLDDSSVDKVVSCPPFGHQFSTDENLTTLYSQVMHEIGRVLKPDGRIAMLINEGNIDVLLEALDSAKLTIETIRETFRIGNLKASIVVASKSSRCRSLITKEDHGLLRRHRILPWENEAEGDETKATKKGRALWEHLRLQETMPLRPYYTESDLKNRLGQND